MPVETGRDLHEFIDLPWRIQRNDPCWVPPIRSLQRRILDPRRGPFFEIGDARYFMAHRNGTPCGRISAHINRRHEACHGNGDGFFGFFECADDQEAAAALFASAAGWLGERGKTRVLGPMSFSIYDEVGLLVEGFDALPAVLQTHNPPYYDGLWTGWGFRKAIDWYALRIRNDHGDPEVMASEVRRIMEGQGLTLRCPEPQDVIRRADEILEFFNASWARNWGHVPFTRKQFYAALGQLRPMLRSDLIRLVEDGSRIVAFIITIPDLNPVLRRLNGRLRPWDVARLYCEARFRPLRKVRTVLLGVRREYQHRHLHHALILDTYAHVARNEPELEMGDCSLIAENHAALISALERYGAERYKTFRIYEREI